MKKWIVQITETNVYEVIVEDETKEGASNLDDDFIAETLWSSSNFSEIEIEVLGELGKA